MSIRNIISTAVKKVFDDASFQDLFSGTATVLFSKLIGMALSYAFIILISRVYGAAVTGAFTLATIFVILFALVGRLGLDTALLRFVSEYSAMNRPDLIREVYAKALRYIVPTSILLSFVLLASAEFIAGNIFNAPHLTMDFRIISVAIIPLALLLTHAEVLRAQKRNIEFSFLQTIILPLFSIIILLALNFLTPGAHIPAISYSIAAIIGTVVAFSRTAVPAGAPGNQAEISLQPKDIMRVSVPMMASNILIFVMTWIDTVMIGIFRTESEVGVYSTALRIATLANITLFSVAGVAAAKLVEYYSCREKLKFDQTVRMSSFLIFWITLPIFLCIFIAPSYLMGLFGSEFKEGTPILLVLAVGQFVNVISGPSGLILQMTGNERLFQKLVLGTILLNFVLDIALIIPFGMLGAAIASTLSLISWNIVSVYFVRSIHNVWSFYFPFIWDYVRWNATWDLDSALRYERAVQLIRQRKPCSVVEVGSGNWGISAYAHYPSLAVDMVFDEKVGPGLQTRIQYRGTSLPISDASADLVISTNMLERVPPAGRRRIIQELFRIAKPDGLIYIAVPADALAENAHRRGNDAFIARTGTPHPVLSNYVKHGLPSSHEITEFVRSEAAAIGWSVVVHENTPLSVWEWNMMMFGVEKWVRGIKYFQRIILQPFYPLLRKMKSAYNYRVILIAQRRAFCQNDSYRLPSFFVIGAQRSGTTSIHEWLSQQPGISLPYIKETHFFSDDARYERGLDWYLKQFRDGSDQGIRGEVDPDYLFYREAPFRLKKLIDSPRIIMIFRNPVERAYSHYLLSVSRGYEKLPFAEALRAERNRSARNAEHYRSYFSYMARSAYCEQVRLFRSYFPHSEFLFIKFEDLYEPGKRLDTFLSICRFIGMSSDPVIPDFTVRYNASTEPKSVLLRNILYSDNKIVRLIKDVLSISIPSFDRRLRIGLYLDKLNQSSRKMTNRDWKQAVPLEVWRQSNEEILRLAELTGLDLQNWINRTV